MSWTAPRVWVHGELVTAALKNVHIRDNVLVLKTNIDDEGAPRVQRSAFGFSAGQGNGAVTGAFVELTSYAVIIPAGYLNVAGDGLLISGLFVMSGAATAKNVYFSIGTSPLATVWTGAEVTTRLTFRLLLRRRTSTTAVVTGVFNQWNAPAPVGLTVWKLTAAALAGGDMDFTLQKNLRIWVFCAGANDLLLTDYYVCGFRAKTGVLVP
jgi:hypothetical protein